MLEHDSASSSRCRTGSIYDEKGDRSISLRALANTVERRQQRYREFAEQTIHENELRFIRGAVQHNQLTGSEVFILEIERLTGERMLHRPQGRPMKSD
jgi:hypothetical protein